MSRHNHRLQLSSRGGVMLETMLVLALVLLLCVSGVQFIGKKTNQPFCRVVVGDVNAECMEAPLTIQAGGGFWQS